MNDSKYEYIPDNFNSFQGDLAEGPGHQHNDVEMFLLEGEPVTYFVGGRQVEITPGRLHVFWAMIPHRLVHESEGSSSGRTLHSLHIPLSWVLQWQLPSTFATALLHGEFLSQPENNDSLEPAGRDELQIFRQWHRQVTSGNPQRSRAVLLEVRARLLNLALDLEGVGYFTAGERATQNSLRNGEFSTIERIMSHIALHYNEDLSMADIARSANLNEKYAMRLFRATSGTTMLQYLMQHRVWHAQRLLSTTNLKMVEVARAVGFGSDSQFYATFKRISGAPPREYREQAQGRNFRAEPEIPLRLRAGEDFRVQVSRNINSPVSRPQDIAAPPPVPAIRRTPTGTSMTKYAANSIGVKRALEKA